MPDRPPFPIPDEIDPPKMCLQLCIPDDPTWKRVINGLLSELGQWYNWQRDDAKSGKELAQVWRKIYNDIDWSNMSCCSNCPPPRFRFGPDGTYEISTDGGATWEPAPDYDYRNNSVLFPPLSAGGISNTKCQAADSVVVTINDKIIQDMSEGQGAAAILALIAAVLLVFLTAGSGLIIASMPGIAGAILGVGIAATQAAFTSEVLETFRCLVYNNMDSDDSISEAGVAALLQDIHDEFEGIVNIVLTNIVNGAGMVGLTNMMRSNSGDPDANCEDCEPPTCFTAYEPYCGIGEVLSVESDHIVVECGVSSITGGYGIALTTGNPAFGCYVTDVQTMEGVSFAPLSAWRTMAQDIPACGDGFGNVNVYCNQTHTFVLYGLSDGEQLKIFLSDEPCPP